MNLGFFVEFPQEELEKLSMIDFPVTIYIAANSLDEFRALEKYAYEINPKAKASYWPILEKSHWVSPFSYNRELDRLNEDLSRNKEELEVLLDLELPTFWLFLLFIIFPAY